MPHPNLDQDIQDVWRALAAGEITEQEAEQRAAPLIAQQPRRRAPDEPARRPLVRSLTRHSYEPHPSRRANRELRRILSSDGRLTSEIRALFSEAERSVLRVIAGEHRAAGHCALALRTLAERSGCSVSSVRNALRGAADRKILRIQQRKLPGQFFNQTNVIVITDAAWLEWLRSPIKIGCKKLHHARTPPKIFRPIKTDLNNPGAERAERPEAGIRKREREAA